MNTAAIAGALCSVLSGILFYMSSPNRKLAAGVSGMRHLRWVATGAGVLGLVLLLRFHGSGTSAFIFLTLLMLVLSFFPLAIAWWQGAPEERK
jgi:hypothetical protein